MKRGRGWRGEEKRTIEKKRTRWQCRGTERNIGRVYMTFCLADKSLIKSSTMVVIIQFKSQLKDAERKKGTTGLINIGVSHFAHTPMLVAQIYVIIYAIRMGFPS